LRETVVASPRDTLAACRAVIKSRQSDGAPTEAFTRETSNETLATSRNQSPENDGTGGDFISV
jgi:hypothetical protein